MNFEERSDLVLAFARVLFVNGQSTEQTLDAAERLGDIVGQHVKILARWGELQLQAEDGDARLLSAVAADPTGVNMDRVASTMRAIEDLRAGRLALAAAMEAIRTISQAPPAPTWMFTLAASAGAVALAVIFGIQHLSAAALIFVSAGAGAILASQVGAPQHKRFPATILRLAPRWRYRRSGGSVPFELDPAPCRSLPMHDPGARAACAQRRIGSSQGPR
jgi:uncharacterized membrane protein YjjP (DUF1212 family)